MFVELMSFLGFVYIEIYQALDWNSQCFSLSNELLNILKRSESFYLPFSRYTHTLALSDYINCQAVDGCRGMCSAGESDMSNRGYRPNGLLILDISMSPHRPHKAPHQPTVKPAQQSTT